MPFADIVTTVRDKKPVDPNSDTETCKLSLENNLLRRWEQACKCEITRDFLAKLANVNSDKILDFGLANPPKITVFPGALTTHERIGKGGIKCWSGFFRVQAHPIFQYLIYSTGIGSKTAMGMGCVEIFK